MNTASILVSIVLVIFVVTWQNDNKPTVNNNKNKKMKKINIPVVLLLMLWSCNQANEKAKTHCNCPITEIVDKKTEKGQDSSDQAWNADARGDVEAVVKKAVDAKISITGSYSNSNQKLEEVYREIVGSNPQITQKANLYRSVACAYYEIACLDKALNDKEKNDRLNEIVGVYEQNIHKIIKDAEIQPSSDSNNRNIFKSNNFNETKSAKPYAKSKIKNDSINPNYSPRNISQEGKNNLYIEGDNKGNVNVGDIYQKPPQRHVTIEDLNRIYKHIPDKNTKIKVSSSGCIECNIFRDEILKALFQNGYKNLITVVVGPSINYFKSERLTIENGRDGNDTWVEIIVNPQE